MWPDGEGPIEAHHRLFVPLERVQRIAADAVRVGRLRRPHGEYLVVRRRCVRMPLERRQRASAVVERLRIAGPHGKSLLVAPDRLAVPLERLQYDAAAVERLG